MTPAPTHIYSFAEAARVVNCSESTLRRKLKEDGRRLGATFNGRRWQIPVTTLEAMGVIDTLSDTPVTPTVEPSDKERIAELERELAVYKERSAQQERRIGDLLAQIADQRAAMRLLEAPKPEPGGQEAPAKRGLLARLFGV